VRPSASPGWCNVTHHLTADDKESPGMTGAGTPLAAWNGFDPNEGCDTACSTTGGSS
jgi:hypothetical protein